ncbi:hypothetical protein TWF694_002996 [Orbilia ellipsospora]|uniref:Copper homeostasis protein cutC homolog n=1 Tax=Orbilia ellipsospora TaxID=2528407 RepID=A0AAV9X0G0_9PEZI
MLEIACFNLQSALIAAGQGVSRIELCAGASVGGTTPPKATLGELKGQTTIPVNVMIRPRGGDFVYTDEEFNQMKEDIELFRDQVDGFVFGILTLEGRVDEEQCTTLVQLANLNGKKHCTFHRAFDFCETPLEDNVEAISRCGFDAILTSGGKDNAMEGVEVVQALQEDFAGRIRFILAGGVRSVNMKILREKAPSVTWFHSAAITDGGEIADEAEIQRLSRCFA